jgi:hypothetical protein
VREVVKSVFEAEHLRQSAPVPTRVVTALLLDLHPHTQLAAIRLKPSSVLPFASYLTPGLAPPSSMVCSTSRMSIMVQSVNLALLSAENSLTKSLTICVTEARNFPSARSSINPFTTQITAMHQSPSVFRVSKSMLSKPGCRCFLVLLEISRSDVRGRGRVERAQRSHLELSQRPELGCLR